MLKLNSHSEKQDTAARLDGAPSSSLYLRACGEKGSVLFYVFIAIGLLGALTLSFVDTSREGAVTQRAQRLTEEIYTQANAVRGAILECVHLYPSGGGDLDGDDDIDSDDNDNAPYPLSPSDANNPDGAAANDQVRNIKCPGAPEDAEAIYDGVGTTGRFLPDIPNGFTEWTYVNAPGEVLIETVGTAGDRAVEIAVQRVRDRFDTCEAEINYGSCGTNCLSVFLKRDSCP